MSSTVAPSRISPADGERRLCSAISEIPGRSSASENGRALRPLGERRLEPRQRHRLAAAVDLVAGVLDDALEHAHARRQLLGHRHQSLEAAAARPSSSAASAARTPSSSVSARPAT